MIPEENTTIDFIRNPELLNRNTIPVLQEAIRQYPYHQSLYLLLLQNMYKVHDPHFSSALKQYALMVADRSVLFEMVEGMNYNIPVQKLEEETVVADGDRTLRLIDNFLKSIPEAQSGRSERSERQDAADPQIDYSAYLEQLPDFEEAVDAPLAEIGEMVKPVSLIRLVNQVTLAKRLSPFPLTKSLPSVPSGATLPRPTICPRLKSATKKSKIATSIPRQWLEFT